MRPFARLVMTTLLGVVVCAAALADTPAPLVTQKVTYPAADGVVVTADFSTIGDLKVARKKPTLVLLHMAHSSRGEYRDLVPEFAKSGYNCLAVDLRCGSHQNDVARGVENETAKSALSKKKPHHYSDAMADLEATFEWLDRQKLAGPRVLVGSSFSAALALVYAARHDGELACVMALSPNEYLEKYRVIDEVPKLAKTPAYVMVGNAQEREVGERYIQAMKCKPRFLHAPDVGAHGSRAFGKDIAEKEATKNLHYFMTFLDRVVGKA